MKKPRFDYNYEQKNVLARALRKELGALSLLLKREDLPILSRTIFDSQVSQIIKVAEEIGLDKLLEMEY